MFGDVDPTGPFAVPKTRLERRITEMEKSVWTGMGMALGMSIVGFLFYLFLGERKVQLW